MSIKENILTEMFSYQEERYRKFQKNLLPTVPIEKIIGVRTPILRSIAKTIDRSGDRSYLQIKSDYLEEKTLKALLLNEMKDFSVCIENIKKILPEIDNWQTCDILGPKILKKYPEQMRPYAYQWLESDREYTVRYGISVLMENFLDEYFSEEDFLCIAAIQREDYYIQMMVAWYFATALAKQWNTAVRYLEQKKLTPWIHRKTIQKAVESRRISEEKKVYLKGLRK